MSLTNTHGQERRNKVTTRWQATNERQSKATGERTDSQTNGNGKANGAGTDQIGIFRIPSLPGVEVLAAEGAIATGRPVLHNDLEVRFVVRGAVRIEFNHQVHVAREGWLLHLPPGELHTLAPADTEEHSFLALRVGFED